MSCILVIWQCKVIILYPEYFSSDENPIWVNGELNSNLIKERRKEGKEDSGRQFTNEEKMETQFNQYYHKMTPENILSAKDI